MGIRRSAFGRYGFVGCGKLVSNLFNGGIILEQAEAKYELATFAGGCFWCMVKPFDKWPGVVSIVSGYTGGQQENPSYEEVCSGTTGHHEAVQITFDADVFPYEKLLDVYWQQIDPTDAGGQFCDRGSSYQTAIFYHSENQKQIAQMSKEALASSGRFTKPIVVPILPATAFYLAETYHQHFYKKDPDHYSAYRQGSGRNEFIHTHWEK